MAPTNPALATAAREPSGEDPPRKMAAWRMPPDLLTEFRATCRRRGVSQTDVLEGLIREYLAAPAPAGVPQ